MLFDAVFAATDSSPMFFISKIMVCNIAGIPVGREINVVYLLMLLCVLKQLMYVRCMVCLSEINSHLLCLRVNSSRIIM